MQKLINRSLVRLMKFSRKHWLRMAKDPSLSIFRGVASILTMEGLQHFDLQVYFW